MTTNIYLAKLLATEREHDLLEQAQLRQRARAAKGRRRAPWRTFRRSARVTRTTPEVA